MIERCTNHKKRAYRWYGALGVKICDRWLIFTNFLEDMGERPLGCTIDRVDPYGDYELENCRWAIRVIQNNNKR